MTHDHAWRRLPDLLGSHDDAVLLAHVAGCHACQRQLFLLGRVDRMLRQARPKEHRAARARVARFGIAAVLAAVGAAAALAFLPFLPRSAPQAFVLRAVGGRALGSAKIVRVDSSNVEVSLVARGMSAGDGAQLLLWARTGDGGGVVPVGRFMVDRRGDCRATFTLPTSHHWLGFWVTSSSDPSVLVATT